MEALGLFSLAELFLLGLALVIAVVTKHGVSSLLIASHDCDNRVAVPQECYQVLVFGFWFGLSFCAVPFYQNYVCGKQLQVENDNIIRHMREESSQEAAEAASKINELGLACGKETVRADQLQAEVEKLRLNNKKTESVPLK